MSLKSFLIGAMMCLTSTGFAAAADKPAGTPASSDATTAPARHHEPTTPLSHEQAREAYAYAVGVEAYIYGYPLVEMYRIRYNRMFKPVIGGTSSPNAFYHARNLLDYKATSVVAPNNDTLYSTAYLYLEKEPIVLDVPDSPGRFYVMHFMDFYTNQFAYVGSRTTGDKAGSYAIVGPGWKGELPKGLKRIDSPTNQIWLLGRTLVTGPEDLAAVHAQQDRYHLTPLSDWVNKSTPAQQPRPDMPAYDLSEPLRFFEFLNLTLHDNPPPAREAALMRVFADIGVGADKTFKVADLDPATARGLLRAIEDGARIVASSRERAKPVNGWEPPLPASGKFGEDYLLRAITAKYAMAAMTPEEDYNFVLGLNDTPLHGDKKYTLRFEKGQLPPVNAFWSITMYRMPVGFFVQNPINRYSIGDRTRGVHYDADGSLTLYVQHDSPGADKESNWLPAPEGAFALALRCYGPRKAILDGSWIPPAIHEQSATH